MCLALPDPPRPRGRHRSAGGEEIDDEGRRRGRLRRRRENCLIVLVVVVVLGVLVEVQSTTKDDDEDDYGKTREFPDRPRGRRRPRSVGWKEIEHDDEARIIGDGAKHILARSASGVWTFRDG